jgi:hypothetical protein
MSPDLLQFLFLVTSTAIVLGVAVTLRGLYGLVGEPGPRLPAPAGGQEGDAAGSSTPLDPPADRSAAAAAPIAAPRDLREPIVMTVAGVFITCGALFALANLINSAP